jgi:hypothetical protein
MVEHPHDDQAGGPPSEPAPRTAAGGPATGPSGATATATGPRRRAGEHDRRHSGADLRKRAVGAIATIISLATTIVVAVLVVHIVFTVFEANGSNGIVTAFRDWADRFAWEFKDVFAPDDPKVVVLVNYGLAAVVYLIAGRIAVGLIRRLA